MLLAEMGTPRRNNVPSKSHTIKLAMANNSALHSLTHSTVPSMPSGPIAPRQKDPRRASPARVWKKLTGSVLLSRVLKRSIIAAGALNGRVRDGNGCDSPAIATSQKRVTSPDNSRESEAAQKAARRLAPGGPGVRSIVLIQG